MRVVRKNKSYNKRYLKIYDNNDKPVNSIFPFYSWFFYSVNPKDEPTRMSCRMAALKNLYWLIGQDCDYDEWVKTIEKLDSGRGVEGKEANNTSQFFNNAEKWTALESFNNK